MRDRPAERARAISDETSSSVLVHGLRPEPRGRLTRAFGLFCDAAMPFCVTLQMLHAEPWLCRSAEVVHICENPTIVSVASNRLGKRCKPILCTEGMPSVAARRLLSMLCTSGVKLLYHGDFDVWGLRIANLIMSEYNARPWRFGAREYLDNLDRGLGIEAVHSHLVNACWDSKLGDTMHRRGMDIHEEQVLDDLLVDLSP